MDVFHDIPMHYLFKMRDIKKFLIETSWLQKAPKLTPGAKHKLYWSEWILDWGPDGKTSMNDYINMIDKYTPTWIVAPDVLRNRKKTLSNYTEFVEISGIHKYLNSGRILWPIQGRSNAELIASIREVGKLIRRARCAYPRVAIPYRCFDGDTCMERARNRVKFIHEDLRKVRSQFSTIHLLGLWDLSEASLCNMDVDSVDSRFAFLQAMYGKSSIDFRDLNQGFDGKFEKVRLSKEKYRQFKANCDLIDELL